MPIDKEYCYKYHYNKIIEDASNNWFVGFADVTTCNQFDFAPNLFGLDLGCGALGLPGRPISLL